MKFLQTHSTPTKPLGIACSGGADSRALFEMLCPLQGELFSHLHLLHVDHALRPEGGEEAAFLEKLCRERGIPFHGARLSPPEKNVEAWCREERRKFFCSVAKKEQLQAVCLAHHADDQAETVLKRLFESGKLERCSGIGAVTSFEGVAFWRPLLAERKSALVRYLQEREISWFEDSTNSVGENLRAKMRREIIPELQKKFGKEVVSSLLQLSFEAEELNSWVEEAFDREVESLGDGAYHIQGKEFALRRFLRVALQREKVFLSREEEARALRALAEKEANLQVGALFVDRGFLFCQPAPEREWDVVENSSASLSWKEIWRGEFTCLAPREYSEVVAVGSLQNQHFAKRLRDKLSKRKVPRILWERLPVFSCAQSVFYEPLTELWSTERGAPLHVLSLTAKKKL